MRTRPERDPQQTTQCVCSIPCECGRSYDGETGRPLAVWLHEGLLEKSHVAHHAYEEGHRFVWDETEILEIESNSRHGKYTELALMACLKKPINQPSLDIPPIGIPLIVDVNKSMGLP
jgi:hypothetical protein